MDLFESECYLSSILSGRVPKETLASLSPLLYELHSLLKMDFNDVCYICYSCPELLDNNIYNIISNLNSLKAIYNVSSREIKYLFLKYTKLLLLKSDYIKYKIDLISATFDFSNKDAFKMVYIFPEMLYLTKEHIKNQVELISNKFDEYGIVVRKHFRREPRLLFASSENIDRARRFLMKNYTLTEDEVHVVFKASPSVALMTESELNSLFNNYYPTYFIKRDIKEILSVCPEFLSLPAKSVLKKVTEIQEVFGLEQKKACELIRKIPDILFFESCYEKVKSFTKFNISLDYIKAFPEICLYPEISIPLKFVITRILSLEQNFDLICKMDTNLFISRFLFMQSYGFYEYSDLLTSEKDFEEKYHISSQVLKISYRLDHTTLDNICKYYLTLKDKINNWSDIIFPEYDKILSYLLGVQRGKTKSRNYGYYNYREKYNMFRGQYLALETLKSFELSGSEAKMILNKNQLLSSYVLKDLTKNISLLKKYGLSQEQIVMLLIKKPSLFTFSVRDFAAVLEYLSDKENCDIEEILYHHLY